MLRLLLTALSNYFLPCLGNLFRNDSEEGIPQMNCYSPCKNHLLYTAAWNWKWKTIVVIHWIILMNGLRLVHKHLVASTRCSKHNVLIGYQMTWWASPCWPWFFKWNSWWRRPRRRTLSSVEAQGLTCFTGCNIHRRWVIQYWEHKVSFFLREWNSLHLFGNDCLHLLKWVMQSSNAFKWYQILW